MTSLSGIRVLRPSDRLFEPLYNALIILDGLGIAIMAVQSEGRFEFVGTPITTARCGSFPLDVRFPLLLPMVSVVEGQPLVEIPFEIGPRIPMPDPGPNRKAHEVPNYANHVLRAITPIYVDFFERHRRWLKTTLGGDPNAWPALFNFSRAIRNFISHNDGCVEFENSKAPAVTWHHLSYSPLDKDKVVVGKDICIGDLLILFFELSDELDRLGCPLKP